MAQQLMTAEELSRRLVKILDRHTASDYGRCRECGFRFPCPTAQLGNGQSIT